MDIMPCPRCHKTPCVDPQNPSARTTSDEQTLASLDMQIATLTRKRDRLTQSLDRMPAPR